MSFEAAGFRAFLHRPKGVISPVVTATTKHPHGHGGGGGPPVSAPNK